MKKAHHYKALLSTGQHFTARPYAARHSTSLSKRKEGMGERWARVKKLNRDGKIIRERYSIKMIFLIFFKEKG